VLWTKTKDKLDEFGLRLLCLDELQTRPLATQQLALKLYAIRQTTTLPLTIMLRVNDPNRFGPSELAFFENLIRNKYDIKGIPIKFIVRKNKA
jgi:predicted GTPase